jgi:hypothetical protein
MPIYRLEMVFETKEELPMPDGAVLIQGIAPAILAGLPEGTSLRILVPPVVSRLEDD